MGVEIITITTTPAGPATMVAGAMATGVVMGVATGSLLLLLLFSKSHMYYIVYK